MTAPFIKRNTCINCGSSALTKIWTEKNKPNLVPTLSEFLKENPVLVKCGNCSFAFVQSIPASPQFYDNLYKDDARDVSIDFVYSGKKLIFKQISNLLEKYIPTNATICDIGAGTGTFIYSLKDKYKTFGVELSKQSANYGTSQGLNMVHGDISSLPTNSRFNAMTLIDVLEHLESPLQTVNKINTLLTEDGVLIVKVPNYKMQLIKQRLLNFLGLSDEGIMQNFVHINHFTPKSLKYLLETCGFSILDASGTPPEIWDLKWKNAPKSVVSRFLYNFVVLTTTNLLSLLGINFSFNFLMCARKVKK